MNSSSNIRVSIQFSQPSFFAGEDVECTITFKNVAPSAPSRTTPLNTANGRTLRPRLPRISSTRTAPSLKKGHRHALSLNNTPRDLSPASRDVIGIEDQNHGNATPRHGRSLSILSIGSNSTIGEHTGRLGNESFARARGGHSRSNSLQAVSRRGTGTYEGPVTSNLNPQKSHLSSKSVSNPGFVKSGRTLTFRTTTISSTTNRSPRVPQQNFKFPPSPSEISSTAESPNRELETPLSPNARSSPFRTHSPRPYEVGGTTIDGPANPIARIISASSVNGTPRSSIDLYSMSNHSSETLASEYPLHPAEGRQYARDGHHSSQLLAEPVAVSETLMMGYVQIMGSFILDGSLANLAPFEEVKRKGVVGGQGGGGVVGLEHKKRDTGFFGSLGWSSIGESIGGFLAGGELSSIKEMRSIASSKSIPLMSTPPGILFVDLKLQPGESRRYSYSFRLPSDLPPSHKGRAIKVSYNLTVGIQRPGSSNEQRVRSVEVPFRVLGNVNSNGELPCHDLLNPHIYLRDVAKSSPLSIHSPAPSKEPLNRDPSSFLQYVDTLLSKPFPHASLLSPTSPPAPTSPSTPRRGSIFPEPTTTQERIDLAILRSNNLQPNTGPNASSFANKFSISRSSLPICTLHLPRPSFRLGETITLLLDFRGARIPTFWVSLALESAESIDSSIAMRSPASAYRHTRRTHAVVAENSAFAKRLGVQLPIPGGATADFDTSGVRLKWGVRVAFVTPCVGVRVRGERDGLKDGDDSGESGGHSMKREGRGTSADDVRGDVEFDETLMVVVTDDERGKLLQGAENLDVESFEVTIPIRVFGAVVPGDREGEGEAEEDLVI